MNALTQLAKCCAALFATLLFAHAGLHAQSNEQADLELEMSIDNDQAGIGTPVVFDIVVSNKGPKPATGVQVKAKLAGGYQLTNSSVDGGAYVGATGIWTIGSIPVGESFTLLQEAMVLDGDYLNLAEVMTVDQADPDSRPANGVDTDEDQQVVDDPGDEDDGDGQDLKRELETSVTGGDRPPGIRADLTDVKGNAASYYFDFETMAMRVELDKKKKQPELFFDREGYVYSASKKKDYVKIPFEKLKKLRMFPTVVSGGILPPLDFPDGTVKYYGMDLSPRRFPILEWAFVYKTEHFEGRPELRKEILSCRGTEGCIKYTLTEGAEAGSYVLFDHEQRLAEIFTVNSGKAVYTYEPTRVTLPEAKEMPFMTDMF